MRISRPFRSSHAVWSLNSNSGGGGGGGGGSIDRRSSSSSNSSSSSSSSSSGSSSTSSRSSSSSSMQPINIEVDKMYKVYGTELVVLRCVKYECSVVYTFPFPFLLFLL